MKNLIPLLLFLSIISCEKNNRADKITESENQPFQFAEIGNKELLTTKFPQQWKVHIYESSLPVSKSDETHESNLNKLDYFETVQGKSAKNKNYNSILSEKGIRVDSIFVIDSISNKKQSFVYLKSFKTMEDPDYDFPPTVKQIDILVFEGSQFLRKLNIYAEKNYPFAVDIKLGYFNKEGDLVTKEFQTDEESTTFTKEERCKLSKNGKIVPPTSDKTKSAHEVDRK